MNKDVIKDKNLHVKQEFYQQLINGFEQEKQNETNPNVIDYDKTPIVMNSAQSLRFNKIVLPIILKSVQKQKLIQNYYCNIVDGERNKFLSYLRNKVSTVQRQITDEEDQIQNQMSDVKNTSGTLDKLVKISRTYSKVKKIITIMMTIKTLFKNNKSQFMVKYQMFKNKKHQDEINQQLKKRVISSQPFLESVLLQIIAPSCMQFSKTIDEKINFIISEFWWWIVKKIFLPDIKEAKSWRDVVENYLQLTIWSFTWAATIAAAVLTVASGGTASAPASALATTAWGVRFAKYGKSFKKLVGGIKKLKKTFKFSDGSKKAQRLAKIRRFKKGLKRFKRKKRVLKGALYLGSGLYTGLDIINWDKEDTKQLRQWADKKGQKWNKKVQANLQIALNNKIKKISQITNFIDDAGADLMSVVDLMNVNDGVLSFYQKKYKIEIYFSGINKINAVNVLANVTNELNKYTNFLFNSFESHYKKHLSSQNVLKLISFNDVGRKLKISDTELQYQFNNPNVVKMRRDFKIKIKKNGEIIWEKHHDKFYNNFNTDNKENSYIKSIYKSKDGKIIEWKRNVITTLELSEKGLIDRDVHIKENGFETRGKYVLDQLYNNYALDWLYTIDEKQQYDKPIRVNNEYYIPIDKKPQLLLNYDTGAIIGVGIKIQFPKTKEIKTNNVLLVYSNPFRRFFGKSWGAYNSKTLSSDEVGCFVFINGKDKENQNVILSRVEPYDDNSYLQTLVRYDWGFDLYKYKIPQKHYGWPDTINGLSLLIVDTQKLNYQKQKEITGKLEKLREKIGTLFKI